MEDTPPQFASRDPVQPELLWPAEELTRKQAILSDGGMELSPAVKKVIRCAECILARRPLLDEEPSFTTTEIARCTGLAPSGVRKAVSWLSYLGLVEKLEVPPMPLYGGKVPAVYRPAISDDKTLFLASTRDGCTRTTLQTFLEGLTLSQRQVLDYLARFIRAEAADDQPQLVTQTDILAETPLNSQTTGDILQALSRTGILERTSAWVPRKDICYVSTELGFRLLNKMPLSHEDTSA